LHLATYQVITLRPNLYRSGLGATMENMYVSEEPILLFSFWDVHLTAISKKIDMVT